MVAEDVEHRATQLPHPGEDAEQLEHPGAEPHLAWAARERIHPGEQGRRQIELDSIVALELALERLLESAAGIKPRHLIFVLVGHELEEIARDRLGKSALTRRD